jgi:hypothetical protein
MGGAGILGNKQVWTFEQWFEAGKKAKEYGIEWNHKHGTDGIREKSAAGTGVQQPAIDGNDRRENLPLPKQGRSADGSLF